jgi:hypothetical protein
VLSLAHAWKQASKQACKETNKQCALPCRWRVAVYRVEGNRKNLRIYIGHITFYHRIHQYLQPCCCPLNMAQSSPCTVKSYAYTCPCKYSQEDTKCSHKIALILPSFTSHPTTYPSPANPPATPAQKNAIAHNVEHARCHIPFQRSRCVGRYIYNPKTHTHTDTQTP